MEFLTIAVAHFLALLSPGPDFFLILQRSLTVSRRQCLSLCLGIATANGVYIAIAVAGLESLRQLTSLAMVLKYCGALYLMYLGYCLLKASPRRFADQAMGYTMHGKQSNKGQRHQFIIGFVQAILNPKNGIFYLSLFSALISERTGIEIRALYGLWMVSVVFLWDCAIALFMGHGNIQKRFEQFITPIERICGAMLICFGVLLSIG